MKHKHFLLLIFSIFFMGNIQAKSAPISIQSPDGKLIVKIRLDDKISYDVYSGNELLLKDCSLAMDLGNETLGSDPQLKSTKKGTINEQIKREVPLKNAMVNNHCNTLLLTFKKNFSVEFRAFNDGIAYRFITNIKKEIEVKNETFAINFPGDYLAHIAQSGSFKTAYESPYKHLKTSAYTSKKDISYLPVLIETDKGYKILISEADLSDYPCMFLRGTDSNGMVSTFPKCPLEFGEDGDRSQKIVKEADYIAKTSGQRSFPWRTFVLAKEDKQLVENEMIYKLSSPCEVKDLSWLKPGQVSWEWWNDASPYHVDFVSGYNLDTYKYYIDFASKFGISYILMDEGWAMSTLDPYTPNPKVDLFELIRYGKEKNVKIVLWLTWLTVEKNFDLFKKFSEWGIAGVKIDFMERSDQWMVNYYERVAKEAAKYKLFVDFHGAFKPAGLERRYPNVLAYEGVLGMEQGGNTKPDNSIYLPFMRNAVGAMDYTPGAMLSYQPEYFQSSRANAGSTGTRAYQMALYVIFETGLQMLADNPTNYYREKECTEFITKVPVTWDETKVLYAKIGEGVIVAKRKGSQWFIGGMTNSGGKTVEVSLDFLPAGRTYTMTSFEDGVNSYKQAMDYKKRESKVTNQTKLTIKMVRNGGWAGIIE